VNNTHIHFSSDN